MAIAPDGITVVTATAFEARAVRAAMRGSVRIINAGVALRALREPIGGVAISCGLAGSLREDLRPGSVLVPRSVRRPDGTTLECDPQYSAALSRAACELGLQPIEDPLVTSEHIVRGAERARWAQEGYAGADMETGLLQAPRVACVRVALDSPAHELSAAWETPLRALLVPRAWFDLLFFVREAPRCAALAAKILATALAR